MNKKIRHLKNQQNKIITVAQACKAHARKEVDTSFTLSIEQWLKMTEATEDEDWLVECSDEEFKNSKDPWEPEPSEIDRLYTLLEKGELPELKWSCPGYRAPSPEMPNTPQEKEEKKIEEQDDFDFMDEATTPKLKIRNKGEETLKGSAKKKTTSLDGVLSTMKKHHLLPSNVK